MKTSDLWDTLESQKFNKNEFPNIVSEPFDTLQRQLSSSFSSTYGVKRISTTEVEFLVLGVQGKINTAKPIETEKRNIIFLANKAFAPSKKQEEFMTLTLVIPLEVTKVTIKQIIAAGAIEVNQNISDISDFIFSEDVIQIPILAPFLKVTASVPPGAKKTPIEDLGFAPRTQSRVT